MRELGIAFIITSVASLGLFSILSLVLQFDDHVAEGMAGMPFVATHHICEMLERQRIRRVPAEKRGELISSYEGYGISWPLATAYGVMLFVGIMAAMSVYSVIGLEIIGGSRRGALGYSIGIVNIPVLLLAYYFVGIFIGSRCMRRGFVAILLIGLIGSMAVRALDFSLLSAEEFVQMWGNEKSLEIFCEFLLSGCLFFWVPGLLGYWRGSRLRLSRYLAYLLHVLPKDTRQTLVTLAYSEAQTLAARPAQPALAISPPLEGVPEAS